MANLSNTFNFGRYGYFAVSFLGLYLFDFRFAFLSLHFHPRAPDPPGSVPPYLFRRPPLPPSLPSSPSSPHTLLRIPACWRTSAVDPHWTRRSRPSPRAHRAVVGAPASHGSYGSHTSIHSHRKTAAAGVLLTLARCAGPPSAPVFDEAVGTIHAPPPCPLPLQLSGENTLDTHQRNWEEGDCAPPRQRIFDAYASLAVDGLSASSIDSAYGYVHYLKRAGTHRSRRGAGPRSTWTRRQRECTDEEVAGRWEPEEAGGGGAGGGGEEEESPPRADAFASRATQQRCRRIVLARCMLGRQREEWGGAGGERGAEQGTTGCGVQEGVYAVAGKQDVLRG
ncbi:hypothetical protein B0H13DRAFT_2649382 [Mycena leptocephala]|nr:hypothetical protein B0H13DRAFT_2649382 [Mycena leptocephala]